MKYMKQLDAIRAFAVLAVLYEHFYSNHTKPLFLLKKSVGWGNLGVGLFFVLSGFLITGILLKSKEKVESGGESLSTAMKTFIIRRSLRIFPIYFLVLAVGFVVGVSAIRDLIWWLATYTSNIYFAYHAEWAWPVTHLWSLSVEEQFYLVWPWVILLTPRRRLLPVIVFVIALGPLFKHVCEMFHAHYMVGYVTTLGNLDLLGIGALLAYLKHYNVSPSFTDLYLKLCLTVGGAFFLQSVILDALSIHNSLETLNQVFEGFFYCWVVNKASVGFRGAAGWVLELKPVVFLGKISYGIYLYHLFIFAALLAYVDRLPPIFKSPEVQLGTCTVVTIVISTLSWYIVEAPILKLKDRMATSKEIVAAEPIGMCEDT